MTIEARHGRAGSCASVRVTETATPMGWHCHASLILGLVDAGTRTLRTSSGVRTLTAGTGFVIPPGTAHAWEEAGGGAYRVLAVEAVASAWGAATIADPAWRAAFEAAHAAVESGAANSESLVNALIALTDRLVPPAPRAVRATVARRARVLTGSRLDESLPLTELGAAVGVSPFHLHRLYRQAWGLTPAQHRLSARLHEARCLLLAGAGVAAAAMAAGFADQSHFCRAFRKAMGVAPTTWLRQIRDSHAFR
jgi:AraC-like DNA-binding protein